MKLHLLIITVIMVSIFLKMNSLFTREKAKPQVVQSGTVQFRIVDAGSSKPVSSVKVNVLPFYYQIYANEDGKFALIDIPAQQYVLRLNKDGYQSTQINYEVQPGMENQVLYIRKEKNRNRISLTDNSNSTQLKNKTVKQGTLRKVFDDDKVSSVSADVESYTISVPVREFNFEKKFAENNPPDFNPFVLKPFEMEYTYQNKQREVYLPGSMNQNFSAGFGLNNSSSVLQEGELNQAQIMIYGSNNTVKAEQYGTGNFSDIQVLLDANTAEIIQQGLWNKARVFQNGFDNQAFILQSSSN